MGEVWDQDYECRISLLSSTECTHSLLLFSLSSGTCLLSVWYRQLLIFLIEFIFPPAWHRRWRKSSAHRTSRSVSWVRGKSPSLTGFPDSGSYAELWSHVFMSPQLVECCFTSTETVGLLGTGAQDVTQLLSSEPHGWSMTMFLYFMCSMISGSTNQRGALTMPSFQHQRGRPISLSSQRTPSQYGELVPDVLHSELSFHFIWGRSVEK